jgi:hypothetical protein
MANGQSQTSEASLFPIPLSTLRLHAVLYVKHGSLVPKVERDDESGACFTSAVPADHIPSA